jgi:hypothetical protein
MTRARRKDLRDLAGVLAQVRAWPDVHERTPGVFWIRRTPFLHFHVRGDDRRAHAKRDGRWGAEIPVPFDAGTRVKTALLRELRARYASCVGITRRPSAGG